MRRAKRKSQWLKIIFQKYCFAATLLGNKN